MGCGGSTDNVSSSDFPSAEPYRNTTAPSGASSPVSTHPLHYYTLSTVKRHNTLQSFWCAIRGKVYDLSDFLMKHPGGIDVLLEEAEGDATVAFEREHGRSFRPHAILQNLHIGLVVPEKDPRSGSLVAVAPGTSVTASASPRPNDHSPAEAAGKGLVGDDADDRRTKNTAATTSVLQSYTMEEVAAHHTIEDCWTVRKGQVYDLTRYFSLQKEGIFKLPNLDHRKLAGLDSTSYFDSSSLLQAESFLLQLERYQIGFLVGHAPTDNPSRRGSRRGSYSASAGRPAMNINYNPRSDEAVEALNAIAADDSDTCGRRGAHCQPKRGEVCLETHFARGFHT